MPKPIPPPTIAASVPPDLHRSYFEGCDRFPFSPKATSHHLPNAWWMAEASFAAYDVFDAAGQSRVNLTPLLTAGWSATPLSAGDTQFLAIENEAALIVAFRGTRLEGFSIPFLTGGIAAHWGDVVTNARFLPASIESGALVHDGFFTAFRAIEQSLTALVDRALAGRKQIWLCGHSLGAALATIAAYKYRGRIRGLCTFGSPRVGNRAFVDALGRSLPNISRFVHNRDIVTTVPPPGIPTAIDGAGWLDALNRLRSGAAVGYAHAGNVKFITGQKSWSILDGEGARNNITALAADAFSHAKEIADTLRRGFSPADLGTWPIPYDAVADHSPVYYANKIFNACEDAT